MTSEEIRSEITAAQAERARLVLDAEPLFRGLLDGVKSFLRDHYRRAVEVAVEKHAVRFNALSPTDKSALKRALGARVENISSDVELQIFHGVAWPHKPAGEPDGRVASRLDRPVFPVSSFSRLVREMRDPLRDQLTRVGMFSHDTWVTTTVAYAKETDPVYRIAQEDQWPASLTQAYGDYRRLASQIEAIDARIAHLEQEFQKALALETWQSL